jgi:hypothetical protein
MQGPDSATMVRVHRVYFFKDENGKVEYNDLHQQTGKDTDINNRLEVTISGIMGV